MNKIALLVTCYNRKTTTIEFLENLYSLGVESDIYILDDNSTDGTYDAIKNDFPLVNLHRGNGNLFWNRGMYEIWKIAMKGHYDFYIWLNDDVIVYDNLISELLFCYNQLQNDSLITGIIESNSNEVIYGGSDGSKKLISPEGKMKAVKYMNGNVVLVSKATFGLLGNLDPKFHHDLGDVDYGLRAIENGINVYSTRFPVGRGIRNSICRERKSGIGLFERFKTLYSPLGSNPRINFHFRRRHFGYSNAVKYYAFQHFLNLLSDGMNEKLFNKKYI